MAPSGVAGVPARSAHLDPRGTKCVSFVDLAQMPIPPDEEARVAKKAAAIIQTDRQDRWVVDDRYKLRGSLGQGSYGQVCEAYDRKEKRAVAIKRSSLAHFDKPQDLKRLLREVAILSALSELEHRNIVRLHDLQAQYDSNSSIRCIYLVLECCDSDLRKLLGTKSVLDRKHVDRLTYTLLCGVECLHRSGVWHRDLKPANCLVMEDCTVKICDFGLSRTVEEAKLEDAQETLEPQRHLTCHVVTRWYRAPELILMQKVYTEAIDIWSVACIYAELLGMIEGVDFADRRPLFPGGSCYPLSPKKSEKKSDGGGTQERQVSDQLDVIFDVLGTPDEAYIEQLDHPQAKQHVRGFRRRQASEARLAERVPTADSSARDLLLSALQFRAAVRPSATELLKHRTFDKIKDPDRAPAPWNPVALPFENVPLDRAGLHNYFHQEVQKFEPAVGASKKHASR